MLEDKDSIALKQLTKGRKDPEELLPLHLPYITHIDDKTLMLRDGDIMTSFTVEGLNADTSRNNIVDDYADAFSRLISQEQSNIAFYIHKVSIETQPTIEGIEGDNFCAEIDRRWQANLASTGLRERTTMITLVLRPNKLAGFLNKFKKSSPKTIREETRARALKLDRITEGFISNFQLLKPQRMTVKGGIWLGLLRSIVTGIYQPLVPGVKFTPLNDLVSNSDISFFQDGITVFGASTETLRHATILTLKSYPESTFAGILDTLNQSIDMIVTHSFTRIDNITALAKIDRLRRQRQASEDAAISLTAQLPLAADDVASGRVVFGDHHCTICIFAKTESELDEAVSMVNRAITEASASVVRESWASQAAFFAQHPSNYKYRSRPSMISSRNFADLTALHGTTKGLPEDRSPWGNAITILPSMRGEPYRFNFHVGGAKEERTVGHSIVLGQTGTGKTLGTAFLVSQAMRLNPRVIVFDKDQGFETAIRALGGDYSAVKMGIETGFNPFQAEDDERGAAWLSDWLEMLATITNDQPLSPEQKIALSRAVQGNLHADKNLQNFASFITQVTSTDDGGDLLNRLQSWSTGGQYQWLFNGLQEDALSLDSQIVAFDLTEIFDNNIIRTAWLSYIFRRIERLVEDERRTLIILDEAWKMLDDEYFQARLKDWLLTMRKKNVAVILLTQRVSHLTDSAAGQAILDSVNTRIIYPSSENTERELEPLNLSDKEEAFLKSSNVGNRSVLIKSGEDSVVVDMNLASLGGGLDVLGGGAGNKLEKGWRDNKAFWRTVMQSQKSNPEA